MFKWVLITPLVSFNIFSLLRIVIAWGALNTLSTSMMVLFSQEVPPDVWQDPKYAYYSTYFWYMSLMAKIKLKLNNTNTGIVSEVVTHKCFIEKLLYENLGKFPRNVNVEVHFFLKSHAYCLKLYKNPSLLSIFSYEFSENVEKAISQNTSAEAHLYCTDKVSSSQYQSDIFDLVLVPRLPAILLSCFWLRRLLRNCKVIN